MQSFMIVAGSLFWLMGYMFSWGYFLAIDGKVPLFITLVSFFIWPVMLGISMGGVNREIILRFCQEEKASK